MLNFPILIVSAVKFWKQCLQTSLASGELRPQSPQISGPQMKIPGGATVDDTWNKVVQDLRNGAADEMRSYRLTFR